MIKRLLFILTAVTVCCNACVKEDGGKTSVHQGQMSKLVGNPYGEKMEGALLVRLSEDAVNSLAEGSFDMNSIFEGLQEAEITPVFPGKTDAVAKRHELHKWFYVSFSTTVSPEQAASMLAGHAEIEAIEFNSILKAAYTPESYEYSETLSTKSKASVSEKLPYNDMLLKDQWDMINDGSVAGSVAGADVSVKDAWRLSAGDPRIIVAVLDQGIATSHPDLQDALWINTAEAGGASGVDDDKNGYVDDVNGYNFAEDNGRPSAGYNSDHGTHVAGTIGATNNNKIGISSIAGGSGKGDGVRLMSCQTFDKSGDTTSEWIAKAFTYAADNGASIAQCSYGHNDMKGMSADEIAKWMKESVEYKALQYFLDPANANCEAVSTNIAVYSAGNYNSPASLYPGALKECISVTAFCPDFLPGGYSNYGAGCDISAPGGDIVEGNASAPCMILSTGLNRDGAPAFVYKYGTSMACPHVSGVVALGMSYALRIGKHFTREDFISRLLSSANDIDRYNTAGGSKLWVDTYWNNSTESWKSEYKSTDISVKKGKMGTGAVDAWNFLMTLEGTPSFMTTPGKKITLDLADILGADFSKYTMELSQDTKDALGISDIPAISEGKAEIICSKIGSGKIRFKASVGKDEAGVIPELDYYKEVSIVSRPAIASNGGWL